jgi:hypothetical protein
MGEIMEEANEQIDRRPANGGGSCASCGASLTLASMKVNDIWFCSTACSDGFLAAGGRDFSVPEPWLWARPRRHFRRRQPKELNSAQSS